MGLDRKRGTGSGQHAGLCGGWSTSLEAPSGSPSNATLTVASGNNLANTQTFAGLILNPGASYLTTVVNGTGTVELNLGTMTANAGGLINFTQGGALSNGVNAINLIWKSPPIVSCSHAS